MSEAGMLTNLQDTGYGLNFRAILDGSWKDSMDGETSFASDWKLFKLHGSTNWLVPYMGVDFQSLEYKSIIPESREAFRLLALPPALCDPQEPVDRWVRSN